MIWAGAGARATRSAHLDHDVGALGDRHGDCRGWVGEMEEDEEVEEDEEDERCFIHLARDLYMLFC